MKPVRKRQALRLALAVLTMAGLGVGDTPRADDEENARAATGRVVILGDSITAGYGLEKSQAYPALMQAKLDAASRPFTVVNAGVSGDTTAGGLRRIAWALGPGADVLLIALGGNDGLRGLSPKQTADNLTGIITKAREKNPALRIILAGMQMPSNMGPEFTKEFQALFPRVAQEQNVTLLPFLLEGVGGDPRFNQDDQIHPNVEGQQRIAETVWKVLEKVIDDPAATP